VRFSVPCGRERESYRHFDGDRLRGKCLKLLAQGGIEYPIVSEKLTRKDSSSC
jgi:hypothetical protein